MAHTPGPYEIEDATEDGAWFLTATADDGSYVVLAGRAAWPKRAEMSLANARLFKAAPEMLAALERFVGVDACDCYTSIEDGPCAWCEAKGVIAKAKGLGVEGKL